MGAEYCGVRCWLGGAVPRERVIGEGVDGL